MSEPPAWKQLFDRLDSTVGTRLDGFVRSDDFATLVALVQRGQRELDARSERFTRRVLHSMNLPAGSDVNRLLAQIGSLEREVRELRNRLADQEHAPSIGVEQGTMPRTRLTPVGAQPDRDKPDRRPPAGPKGDGGKGANRRGTSSGARSGPRAAAS